MGSITDAILLSVLLADKHSQRFEHFCNDLVSDLEGGRPILSTSQSWDLGRDGRDARGEGLFVCATLEGRVETKSVSDIKRLTSQGAAVTRLYVCSSQQLSEKRCAEVERLLRDLLPREVTIVVHGAKQLSSLAMRNLEIGQRHYPAELAECLALLRGASNDASPEEEAFRLSLMTIGNEASDQIRRSLYVGVIRSVLSKGPCSIQECARDVSARLRLHRNLDSEVLEHHLRGLAGAGEVVLKEGRYSLTDEGVARLAEAETAAAAGMIDGRTKFRAALEASLGQTLSDDHFSRIWVIVRQKISHFFYTRGRQMVDEIGRLVNDSPKGALEASATTTGDANQSPSEANKPPLFFIDELSAAVGATGGHPDQKIELRTAVKDVFTERTGPASQWLVGVCAAFVAVCSLGLEATTGRAIARMVASIALVLDTDVVLSLLNEGEPSHKSVDAIVKRWRALHGQLLIAEPVLQEVAHHAWIAEVDFNGVRAILPGSPDDRVRLIENSFVRGFAEFVATSKAKVNNWPSYIKQYKGKTATDISRIADVLRQDYSLGLMPSATGAEVDLERRVRMYLESIVQAKHEGKTLKIARDKAYRDAALYASLVQYYRTLRDLNPDGLCLLVSSAQRLVDIEARFSQLGEPHMVVSIGMVIYLLSLIPDVSIGIGALGSLLFDGEVPRFGSGVDRVVLRVVRESAAADLPWGKRFTLLREVRERLLNNAKAAGIRTRSHQEKDHVLRGALTKRSAGRTAEVLRDSLDAVAADSPAKREASALRKRVKVLEAELIRARERGGR